MDHGPAVKLGTDNASPIKSKIGVILFFVYLIIYSGFVAISVFSLKTMGNIVFAGVNLAIVYGFGLILLAIIMGLIYNAICTAYEDKLNKPKQDENTVVK
ncbi:MAG: hypothetical protein A2020_00170 [Lentisphaerae bacterium GWF2_45_14]|nr:MAG: hypothetical protein A2020_00170 [Lentisphaerae bacterium GWF2_45_14]